MVLFHVFLFSAPFPRGAAKRLNERKDGDVFDDECDDVMPGKKREGTSADFSKLCSILY